MLVDGKDHQGTRKAFTGGTQTRSDMTGARQASQNEPLRDIAWLKEVTGLSESGIRRLVRRATIPSVRIGKRLLFRPSSIEKFITSRETGGDIPPRRGRPRQGTLRGS